MTADQETLDSFIKTLREPIVKMLKGDAEFFHNVMHKDENFAYTLFNKFYNDEICSTHKNEEDRQNCALSRYEMEKRSIIKAKEAQDAVDVASIEDMATSNLMKLDLTGLPNFNYVFLWQDFLSSESYYP
jgi:hypothetical protein